MTHINQSRGITNISYDRFGNPLRISYSNGAYTENVYSASGERLKTIHSTNVTRQSDPSSVFDDILNEFSLKSTEAAASTGVTGTSTTEYRGNLIYRDGKLDMVLFPGGYATVNGSTVTFHYYTQDYFGNNRTVINGSTGAIEQTVAYYPYGGVIADLGNPTGGQPYKFGGKELVTANGLNEYDFGARQYYSAVPGFTKPDPMCEKYYWLSPYLYCGNNSVNAYDPDGNVVIFVNGFHMGDGGQSKYWNGIDAIIVSKIRDSNAIYFDGAIGGVTGLGNFTDFVNHSESNLHIQDRTSAGYEKGYSECATILNMAEESGTSVKFVTHSMGSAYTKGLIQGMMQYGEDNMVDVAGKLNFEVDFAPFQSSEQTPVIKTIVFQHFFDGVAGDKEMQGAKNIVTHKEISYNLFNAFTLIFKEHSISGFLDDIINYWDKEVR